MAHNKTSTESYKGQESTSSGLGGSGDIGISSNINRNSAAITHKDYKGEIEAFGAVLALKYEKVDLKKPFAVFRGKKLPIL